MSDKKTRSASRSTIKSGRLMILFTIVNRRKADYFLDFIQECGANMQTSVMGEGTASSDMMSLLGLTDNEKTVIMSVLKEDDAKTALNGIREKLKTIKNVGGIAFTVPMSSVIGVSLFGFLSDSRETVKK